MQSIKKVTCKYKIKTRNRIHEAFIRSKAKDIAHQKLKFNEDEINFPIYNPPNDNINVVLQCSNINNEIFINDNADIFNNNDIWFNDDIDENIYCNNENETVTYVFQNEKEIKTYILTELRIWGTP